MRYTFSIYVENENIYIYETCDKHSEKLSGYLPSFRFVNSEQRKRNKKNAAAAAACVYKQMIKPSSDQMTVIWVNEKRQFFS